MISTRRTFLQKTALLTAALPLTRGSLTAASAPVPPYASTSVLREMLFSPGNITEKKNCYDRFEPLKKPVQNPVLKAEMPWEKSGVAWGSVLRSSIDGKFKFFYSTDFPGAQAGALYTDKNSNNTITRQSLIRGLMQNAQRVLGLDRADVKRPDNRAQTPATPPTPASPEAPTSTPSRRASQRVASYDGNDATPTQLR